MVGKMSLNPKVDLCCQRVFIIFRESTQHNMTSWKKIKKLLRKMVFPTVIVLVVVFILFVLWKTSRDPSKEIVHKYERIPSIHTEKTSFHYGIVIDCGSSGSRIFIYYWPPHDGNPHKLLKLNQMMDHDNRPVRMKIKPGIASMSDNPWNATDYLHPLLDYAASHVPKSKHQETPVFILATAGMRLIPKSKQNAILDDLRMNIPKRYNFHLSPSQVEVISGKQEGIYLWIAINYILGRFDHSNDVTSVPASTVAPIQRKRTVGCIEMGGASMQIAYEVAQNVSLPQDLSVDINLGCDSHNTVHRYKVYVTTFLGVGTLVARQKYLEMLLRRNSRSLNKGTRIIDPCLSKDFTDDGIYKKRHYSLKGSGRFRTCQNDLVTLLNTTAKCKKKPCSLNGIHQPSVDFRNSEFFGFAEFWYSTQDVLRMGASYEGDKMDQMAVDFCSRTWSVNKKYYDLGLFPKADKNRLRSQCFKSAWMTTVLHFGLKFPRGYKGLTSALIINGKEIQWTLGAMLYRTRFMPLRDIQQQQPQPISYKSSYGWDLWLAYDYTTFSVVLLLCCLIVLAAVVLYCRRIRKSNMLYPVSKAYPHEVKVPFPQDIRVKV